MASSPEPKEQKQEQPKEEKQEHKRRQRARAVQKRRRQVDELSARLQPSLVEPIAGLCGSASAARVDWATLPASVDPVRSPAALLATPRNAQRLPPRLRFSCRRAAAPHHGLSKRACVHPCTGACQTSTQDRDWSAAKWADRLLPGDCEAELDRVVQSCSTQTQPPPRAAAAAAAASRFAAATCRLLPALCQPC